MHRAIPDLGVESDSASHQSNSKRNLLREKIVRGSIYFALIAGHLYRK